MLEYLTKENLAYAAVVLNLLAGAIYIINAIWGRGKPHFVTWFLLGVITSMAFLNQLEAGERVGAIPLGMAAMTNFANCLIGFIKDKKEHGWKFPVTKADWACGVLGLVALYFWQQADNPFVAVWLLTFASLSAFVPTLRRAWRDPWGETLTKYQITTVRYVLTVAALSSYSFVTAFYPAVWIGVNLMTCVLLIARRRSVPKPVLKRGTSLAVA